MPRYECRVGRIETDITTFRILARMSWIATKLYNTALWNARKTWDETGKIPTGFDLQKVVLASNYHDYLPAHTYQHAAHQIGMAFRSWFKLRKTDKTARPPGFRPKNVLSSFMFTDYGFKTVTNECLLLTLGPKLKEELSYPNKRLTLRVKWNMEFPDSGVIQQIEIVPREGYFELHAKIQLPEPVWRTSGQVVAVDLGQRNPIASKDEMGNTDIFNGGGILEIQHYWNKEKSRVLSEVTGRSKGKKKWSNALTRMARKAAGQVNHAVHSLSSKFVQICNSRDVKEVVVGDLKGIKKKEDGTGKNWTDKPSQNWQQFPVAKLVAQVEYKLARLGIRLVEQDERGTSKGRCSLCGCTDRKKLHRVHRGLFHCENCGTVQNADTNGAGNQLARYLHREAEQSVSAGSSGALAAPSVYRWDEHRWTTAVSG